MKNGILLALALLMTSMNYAQELNLTVKVNTQQLQLVDPSVFVTLEQSIAEFLSQKWTNDVFNLDERIDCNFILTLTKENSATNFEVNLAVQSSRPIFGTDQSTPLLNTIDNNVAFDYEQYQPLQFSENRFENNLTSVLAFYVNIILGMDYDSFSPLGGEVYYQKAQEIVNNIPSGLYSTYLGWSSTDGSNSKGSRNRYWIIENLLSPRMRPLRLGMYQYHRQGLDQMTTDVVKGRAAIAEVIETLGQVDQSYPNAILTQLFLNAKRNEVIELFKRGTNTERTAVRQVMTRVDPANGAQYRSL
ncbi:MAG: DUF4835 domain-containing protein [Bacteroidetes bacterium]|nr:MAG: DUF4835 domain-containing protein [Bacteroidota bacterium]PTM12015.1 MAG: DUF4835 domain-containing protein [Bacteroidota bacterium]